MTVATREIRRAFGLGEFARMFGISKDTVKRRVTDGSLRTILVGGRRLVPFGEVERFERDGLYKKAAGAR
jgi:excisionase family DNA binding protein